MKRKSCVNMVTMSIKLYLNGINSKTKNCKQYIYKNLNKKKNSLSKNKCYDENYVNKKKSINDKKKSFNENYVSLNENKVNNVNK